MRIPADAQQFSSAQKQTTSTVYKTRPRSRIHGPSKRFFKGLGFHLSKYYIAKRIVSRRRHEEFFRSMKLRRIYLTLTCRRMRVTSAFRCKRGTDGNARLALRIYLQRETRPPNKLCSQQLRFDDAETSSRVARKD